MSSSFSDSAWHWRRQLLLVVALCGVMAPTASSFVPWRHSSTRTVLTSSSRTVLFRSRTATTVEELTRERTDRRTRSGSYSASEEEDYDDYDEDDYDAADTPPLEYLQDSATSREPDDPFHILLLGTTFDQPKVTVPYVSNSLEYVLSMPQGEAKELSQFAHDEGLSCLGTWTRNECLTLGRQLQVRDIVCRVVPYAPGGQRGWQAKDSYSNNNNELNKVGRGGGEQQRPY